MPLIIIAGGPVSGKTKRAYELASYFSKTYSKEVIVVNEESLKMDKAASYKDSSSEKVLRLAIKSTVEKSLTTSNIVIADSLNYIKGFRYEMFCIARTLQTTITTIYCDTPIEIAKKWNELQVDLKFPFELYLSPIL